MNRFTSFLHEHPQSLNTLALTIALTLSGGLFLAGLIAATTIASEDLTSLPLCFTNSCVGDFLKRIDQAVSIAKSTVDLVVAVATIGGIFVALLSYINTASNAALANHIEHLRVFADYVDSEISKRDMLSPKLIDTLQLYGSIFHQSRSGRTNVSDEYRNFLITLNSIIEESNHRCDVGTPGGFSYTDHQRRVRDHLAAVGITIFIVPRNDYFALEDQLFSLIHRISQSFCSTGSLPALAQRNYH